MVKVEVCIATDDVEAMCQDLHAAHQGGAATVELCSRMDVGGLTPSVEAMLAARSAFPRDGMMVMVRPRPGDFHYNPEELDVMQRSILTAAEADADGVVLGVLSQDQALAHDALSELIALADSLGLHTSLHRAFDDAKHAEETLEDAIDLGVRRVLTAGTPYNADRPAVEGISQIHRLIQVADDRIEIVIGGGVNPENAGQILHGAPSSMRIALHAFSGVRVGGQVQAKRVRDLLQAANP